MEKLKTNHINFIKQYPKSIKKVESNSSVLFEEFFVRPNGTILLVNHMGREFTIDEIAEKYKNNTSDFFFYLVDFMVGGYNIEKQMNKIANIVKKYIKLSSVEN